DPEFAAYAVNLYAEAYRRQHVRVHNETQGSVDFYRDQVNRIQQDVRTQDAEINSFLASAGISDLETEKKLTITVISDLERQSSQLAIDQQAAKGRLDEAEKKFA